MENLGGQTPTFYIFTPNFYIERTIYLFQHCKPGTLSELRLFQRGRGSVAGSAAGRAVVEEEETATGRALAVCW